jgi:lysophospholipase L1-like esterase
MALPSPSPSLRWKKVLFPVVLLVLVAATLEFVATWYLRRFQRYDGQHLLQYEFDPYKNTLPARNYVNTSGIHHNSQGFRRPTDVSREKPAETYRVFLMGGSTAYGLGSLWPHIQREYAVVRDSETIAAFLERYLAASLPGKRIEVINAAITSDWTHHHLIYLNQTILNYHPDMVLFLDGFNDFFFYEKGHDQFASYPYQGRYLTILGDPTLYSLAYADAWWLFRKSAFAHIAMRTLREVKLRLMRPNSDRPPMDVDEAMAGLREVFPRNALTMDRRMGLILRDAGVTAVFMLQPMLILERDHKPMPPAERKYFDFDVQSHLPNYEAFMQSAVRYVRDQEERMARDVGAHFIDLTGIYAGVPEQIYTDFCHLTPLGNELLARDIGQRILPWIQADMMPSQRPSQSYDTFIPSCLP